MSLFLEVKCANCGSMLDAEFSDDRRYNLTERAILVYACEQCMHESAESAYDNGIVKGHALAVNDMLMGAKEKAA